MYNILHMGLKRLIIIAAGLVVMAGCIYLLVINARQLPPGTVKPNKTAVNTPAQTESSLKVSVAPAEQATSVSEPSVPPSASLSSAPKATPQAAAPVSKCQPTAGTKQPLLSATIKGTTSLIPDSQLTQGLLNIAGGLSQ